jgi:hypothetical protein
MEIKLEVSLDTDKTDDRELIEQVVTLLKNLDNQELTQYNNHNKENHK